MWEGRGMGRGAEQYEGDTIPPAGPTRFLAGVVAVSRRFVTARAGGRRGMRASSQHWVSPGFRSTLRDSCE